MSLAKTIIICDPVYVIIYIHAVISPLCLILYIKRLLRWSREKGYECEAKALELRCRPQDTVAYVLICGIVVSEFELQSSYFVYFQTTNLGKDLVGCFLGVLCHINHCTLFNAKSSLYIYIKYIGFGLFEFYGISTLVGHLTPNSVNIYTHIQPKISKRIL